ncbi:MAG: serine hydrolase domain-containing protein [Gemmatimonadales bacterium]
MRRSLFLIALAGLGCRSTPPAPPFAAKLDAAVEAALAARDLPGAAVVVVQGDRVTYQKGYGLADLASSRPMTDSTPIVIGSTSKPLTALAVLRLVQEGQLDLDAPISRYLPDLPFADDRAATMTLRHLLTNRSGLPVGFSGPAYRQPPVTDVEALERLAGEIAATPLLFAPGEGYAYSNRGWALAGYVVQRVSGRPIEDFMRDEVFRPLGMSGTTLAFWEVPNLVTGYAEGFAVRNHPSPPSVTRAYGPAGMIVSTPRDMGRLLAALLNEGRTAGGGQFLTPELVKLALTPQADAESELGGPTRYGLGWEVDSAFGSLTIKKAGSVHTMVTLWIMLPEQRTAVAFAFNREDYGILPLVPNVLKILAGGEADPFPALPAPPAPPGPAGETVGGAALDALLGVYDTRTGDQTVTRRGDSLGVDPDGVPAVLVPLGGDSLAVVDDMVSHAGWVYRFRRQGGRMTLWRGAESLGVRR